MGLTNAEEGLELAINELINKESDNEKMIILLGKSRIDVNE